MSAPIDNPDEPWDKIDEALRYAPPWARQRALQGDRAVRFTRSPPMAPGVGGHNIDAPPPRVHDVPPLSPERFAGDIAAAALRRQLSLDPVIMPEPPIALREERRTSWLFRLGMMLMMAASVVLLAMWVLTPPPRKLEQRAENPAARNVVALPPRLVVEKQRGFANEPLALGVLIDGKPNGETLWLRALKEGTRLSAGTPLGQNGWRLSTADVDRTLVYAPPGFVGTIEARADLRGPGDRLVDSQTLQFEWMPTTKGDRQFALRSVPQPAAITIDADETAALQKRAGEMLKNGDISSARLLLRRLAEAGNPEAALSLGGTFDDEVLAELGAIGFAHDLYQARAWYQRAAQLGSAEAARRLQKFEGAEK